MFFLKLILVSSVRWNSLHIPLIAYKLCIEDVIQFLLIRIIVNKALENLMTDCLGLFPNPLPTPLGMLVLQAQPSKTWRLRNYLSIQYIRDGFEGVPSADGTPWAPRVPGEPPVKFLTCLFIKMKVVIIYCFNINNHKSSFSFVKAYYL